MKLAEALQERADLTRKLDELRTRLTNNALVQEGEETAEDPAELLSEYDAACERLEWLIGRINRTNCLTADEDGVCLTELLSERDVLNLRVRTYRQVVAEASQNVRRAMRTEIKIRPAVNVRALQKQTDRLAAGLRALDNRIQALNWTAELSADAPEGEIPF